MPTDRDVRHSPIRPRSSAVSDGLGSAAGVRVGRGASLMGRECYVRGDRSEDCRHIALRWWNFSGRGSCMLCRCGLRGAFGSFSRETADDSNDPTGEGAGIRTQDSQPEKGRWEKQCAGGLRFYRTAWAQSYRTRPISAKCRLKRSGHGNERMIGADKEKCDIQSATNLRSEWTRPISTRRRLERSVHGGERMIGADGANGTDSIKAQNSI